MLKSYRAAIFALRAENGGFFCIKQKTLIINMLHDTKLYDIV